MHFRGPSLLAIRWGLTLAIGEVQNMIVTCPDVVEHAAQLVGYESERVFLEQLKERVQKAIDKEYTSSTT